MFDGYDSGPPTKDNAHLRRTREQMTEMIDNNECEERYVPFKQEEQTIFHFSAKQKLGANGCQVSHTRGDAD